MRGASTALALVAAALCLAGSASATPLLTTKTVGGTTITVDGTGKEVIFKGIGWYGYNLAMAAPENLSAGVDALSRDFKQVVYRQKQLGFNSIRLAFTFDDTFGIRAPIVNYTKPCTTPPVADIKNALVPNASTYANRQVPTGAQPSASPPNTTAVCNSDLPNNATYDRFIWMCNYYISQGFYVNLDFHSNGNQDKAVKKNMSFGDQGAWINNWKILLTDLQKVPANKGKILVDLINEPDGYNLTWEGTGAVNSSLASYYLNTMDALAPVCPDCLWLLEGGGQYHWCGINWGNGFLTDQPTIKNNAKYNISDPTDFLNKLVMKPYISQVVLAPHIYCPGVTDAITCFSGTELFNGLDQSFGYLTVSPGWCNGGTCRIFPAILDEFGSTFNTTNEMSCMKSVEAYVNAISPAPTNTHAPIKSWFYWAWQPDSYGTGGLVDDDWRSIMWNKIGALTGGTKDFMTGFGLIPWYLANGTSSLQSTGSPGASSIAPPTTPVAVSG